MLSWFHVSVTDPPIVNIELGTNLVARDIKQGVDVYFVCDITANPPPRTKTVTWLHNVSVNKQYRLYKRVKLCQK